MDVLDYAHEACVTLDYLWRVLWLNRAAEVLIGQPREAIVGRAVHELVPDLADLPWLDTVVRVAQDRMAAAFEVTLRAPERHFAVVAYPTRDGLALQARDVTAERHRETAAQTAPAALYAEAMRASERRWQGLFEASTQGIVLLTPGGAVVDANTALLGYAGLTRADLVGRRLADAAWWTAAPNAVADLAEGLRRVAAGERVRFEADLSRPDGAPLPLEVLLSPVPGADGRPVLVVLEARDLTAVRAAQSERLAAESAAMQARHLETLGALAGGLAHDFNNALVGILGQAALARRLPLADQFDEPLAAIELSAQRAAGLVRQLAAYAGRGLREAEPTDLASLAEQVGIELAPACGPGVQLRFVLSRSLPPVRADAAQVRQLVANLVANAVEALPATGGQVEIRTARRYVAADDLRTPWLDTPPPSGDFAVLEVHDTGHGIDDATRARLFQPYVTTKPSGRGLGLAAALGIVRAHGGAITVDSAPGHGTTMRVFLPMLAAPAAAAAVEPAVTDWSASGTILVIDDDPGVRLVVSDLLSRRGFTVVTAANGAEGLERARETDLAGVVLDLTMPVQGGAPTLAALRRSRPEVPVVLMSGSEPPREATPDGFLPKPFSLETFYDVIGKALRVA